MIGVLLVCLAPIVAAQMNSADLLVHIPFEQSPAGAPARLPARRKFACDSAAHGNARAAATVDSFVDNFGSADILYRNVDGQECTECVEEVVRRVACRQCAAQQTHVVFRNASLWKRMIA